MPHLDSSDAQAQRRKQLLDQLEYLAHEVEATRSIIGRIPQGALTAAPRPGAHSVQELYGLLLCRDAKSYTPFIRGLIRGSHPNGGVRAPDDLLSGRNWNEEEIDALLEEVVNARRETVEILRDAPAPAWQNGGTWSDEGCDLYGFAFSITQRDLDLLRQISELLYDARLTEGPGSPV